MLETTSNQSPQTTTVPHLENAVMFLNDIIHLQDTHTLAVCIHLKPGGKKNISKVWLKKGAWMMVSATISYWEIVEMASVF